MPVWVWVSYEFMASGESVRSDPNAAITSSSRSGHGPNTGKKLENLLVIFYVDRSTGSCGFPIGPHTGHRYTSHVRVLKGPLWDLTAPYASAFITTVHGPCAQRTGSVRCLEILTGTARTVMTDYGRFANGCSKNTDNLQNTRMHVTMHIEEGIFHMLFPKIIGPYGSPRTTARDHS